MSAAPTVRLSVLSFVPVLLLMVIASAWAPSAGAQTAPNPNCTLIMPPHPFSPRGLATPYRLTATDPAQGPCNEYNTAQSAFVQAMIFDRETGALAVYNPLVVDKGTKPAVAPVVPELPAHATVAIWFGYNGNNLTLQAAYGEDLGDLNCKDGEGSSVFGQFAYCNAKQFFREVNRAMEKGQVTAPALGMAQDGQPCPTVRSFFVVDQDQSDNLTTQYLVTPSGKIAQFTQNNLAALNGATLLANPSDNRLTSIALAAALGCTPWKAQDLADPGQTVAALPLDELLARARQAAPVALVPAGDPMTQVNGNEDEGKVNRYRKGVDQPVIDSFFDADTGRYCRQMLRIAPTRLFNTTTRGLLSNAASPDGGVAANSLFTFLAQRFVASYQILDCENRIGVADPVSFTADGNGVAISASLNTQALNAAIQELAPHQADDDWADSVARSRRRAD